MRKFGPPPHLVIAKHVPRTAPPQHAVGSRRIAEIVRSVSDPEVAVRSALALHRGWADRRELRAVLSQCAAWSGARPPALAAVLGGLVARGVVEERAGRFRLVVERRQASTPRVPSAANLAATSQLTVRRRRR
jgi:hypothetical protein